MAAHASVKREVSASRSASADELVTRRKKAKVRDGSSDSDDSDNGSGKGKKTKAANSKNRTKKGNDSHPHKCEWQGCERRYTRAEHLHRHQLEHTRDPRHYTCEVPGCDFGCVRKDLLDRHSERHKKEGSNLWRRDQKGRKSKNRNPRIRAADGRSDKVGDQDVQDDIDSAMNGRFHVNSDGHAAMLAHPTPISPSIPNEFMAGNDDSPISPLGTFPPQPTAQPHPQHNGYTSPTSMEANGLPGGFYPMAGQQGPPTSVAGSAFYPDLNAIHEDIGSMGPLPMVRSNMFSAPMEGYGQPAVVYPNGTDAQMDFADAFAGYPMDLSDLPGFDFGMPSYGLSNPRSHIQDPDKERRLTANLQAVQDIQPQFSQMGDGSSDTSGDLPMITPSRSSTPVHKALNPTTLNRDRQREILTFIERKFDDAANPKKIKKREGESSHFSGRHFDNGILNQETKDILNGRALDQYLDIFWREYSPQIPIVHPSIDPNSNETPILLILVMIAIGAAASHSGGASLGKSPESEVAAFIAWNVRTLVQNHEDLICPTETWILQTLVLLESFEKLFSTRLLHERAHQLHGLTVELVRRSECFEGPITVEIDDNDLRGSWKRFIEMESRKRAAYTVFTTDAFHACMFAHKAMVKFQEVELALPCSDNLWECVNEHGFSRAFQSLDKTKVISDNVRELPTFQDTLQRLLKSNMSKDFDKILTNTELQHNRFAFKALLAGFISVHREIDRLSSRNNCQNAFRNLERWVKRSKASSSQQAEEFTELYSISALAQINSRSSVVYLQQIACPTRILGKQVTEARRNAALKQIRRWVRNEFSAGSLHQASGAVCCAARFLTHVFATEQQPRDYGSSVNGIVGGGIAAAHNGPNINNHHLNPNQYNGHQSRTGTSTPASVTPHIPVEVDVNRYMPQADHFLHRPWAVYVAVLCIWAYAYTLEGPLRDEWIVDYEGGAADPRAYEAANIFLSRLAAIETPEQLRGCRELNRCVGLLTVLAERLHQSHWELLREAGDRAEDCVRILRKTSTPVRNWTWCRVTDGTPEEVADSRREMRENAERLEKQLTESAKQEPLVRLRLENMRKAMSKNSPAPRSERSESIR